MTRASVPGRIARLVAGAALLAGCGGGTITFGGGGDGGGDDPRVTVTGNLDEVSPVTTRDIVAFAFSIDADDDSDRCPCPPDPSSSTVGKGVVLASEEATFTLTGLEPGPIGVVFLLDNPGNDADGTIDPGDPIAILDDVDCELDDVDGNITVTLEDVDVLFSATPSSDCRDSAGDPPAPGRARAWQINQERTDDGKK